MFNIVSRSTKFELIWSNWKKTGILFRSKLSSWSRELVLTEVTLWTRMELELGIGKDVRRLSGAEAPFISMAPSSSACFLASPVSPNCPSPSPVSWCTPVRGSRRVDWISGSIMTSP